VNATELAELTGRWAPVSLERLEQQGNSLQRRYDRKHTMDPNRIEELFDLLGGRWQILTTDHGAINQYHTVYFDDPQLTLYRQHRQGRRIRYKVRTRSYNSTLNVLELKLKERDGATDKHRWDHPHSPSTLQQDQIDQTGSTLSQLTGQRIVQPLQESAQNTFHRLCLVSTERAERLTIDLGITLSVPGGPDIALRGAIVEVKSDRPHTTTHTLVRRGGGRAAPVSKYALTLAAHQQAHGANRWHPALRHLGSSHAR
jgi:hypothetical protein